MADEINKYLPLTETTAYTLLALVKPLHGYALMQKVTEMSQGVMHLGPGTLYNAFSTLEREGLIVKVSEVERRKSYQLTAKGRQVLKAHITRMEILVKAGLPVVSDW
jgi:DNA-binding PadR family transcriptional regulator